MTLHWATGDLLESDCQVLVNAVNCVGVTGAGLARQFAERFPEQVAEYRAFCRAGKMAPGVLHEARLPDGRRIVSVPTKRHWRHPSRLGDVQAGLRGLARYCNETRPTSVALPALGCGLGGLPRGVVRAEVVRWLTGIPGQVYAYGFEEE